MDVFGTLTKCPGCGRWVLVERFIFGVNHTGSTKIICWDCLSPEKKQKAKEKYNLNTESVL